MVSFAFAGVRWRVSFVFLLGVTLFLCIDSGGFALALLAAAVLHESGHLLAMAVTGAPVRLIRLEATGMGIVRGDKLSCGEEAVILAAGAASNLLAAGLLLLCGEGLRRFSAANVAVAIFQLLPLGGLDGGSLLELLLVHLLGVDAGCRVARILSTAFAAGTLGAVLWYSACNGWSMGLLLLTMLLTCAILAPKSF